MIYAKLLWLLAATCAADISAVDQLRQDLYTLEHGLWKNISRPEWNSAGLGGDVELAKAFAAFDKMIEGAQHSQLTPSRSELWSNASQSCKVIDDFYGHFATFIRSQAEEAVPRPVEQWLDLTKRVLLDRDNSVAIDVSKLADILEHNNIFSTVLQELESYACQVEASQHQLIYDMYNTVSLTEIKGYAMMQFSFMVHEVYEIGIYETQGASLTRKQYAERTSRTAAAAREALSLASRDVYRCSPPEHIRGETYAEVTRLLQGYIENEVDLNWDGTCRENCAYYTQSTHKGCYDQNGLCAKQTSCRGRIINCKYVESDMNVCQASRSSSRRYEYIEYTSGHVLGRQGYCYLGTTLVNSWWRWLFWHCSYCMCLCDDSGPDSDRYFSLRSATSDVNNNRVVTGVRFVKHDQVFHLQVSEGELGARGNVTPGGWVPVQRFQPHGGEGTDYHTLTYDERLLDLNKVDAPAGHVLTGVRLTMRSSLLHLAIRTTPFNYTTGRLSPEKSEWRDEDNSYRSYRSKLELHKPDIPTRSTYPLYVDSTHDNYVEFTHSDFDEDAAQSTVPFVDIQPLRPMKGAGLLSGAGVIHRGEHRNGGFVALKVFSYDQSQHVSAQPPPLEEKKKYVEPDIVFAPTA